MIIIQSESGEHVPGARAVEEQAFGRPSEAALVDRLRAGSGNAFSGGC